MTDRFLVADLAWDRARDALASGAPAILPVGAAAKQHGLHLPLSTDQYQAEWFAIEAAKRYQGLVWPTLTYGFYPAFVDYAGSMSLRLETFEALALDVIDVLIAQSASCVIVINTGISTIRPIDAAISRCAAPKRVRHLPIYAGPHFKAERDAIMEQATGGHADEIETSVMLAIAPHLVDLDRAEPSPPGRGGADGRLSPNDASSPNYTPSGSLGEPRLATAEKGKRLIAAIMKDLDAACDAPGTD